MGCLHGLIVYGGIALFIPGHIVLAGAGLFLGGAAVFCEVPFFATIEAGPSCRLGVCCIGLGAVPAALLWCMGSVDVHGDWLVIVLSGGCG